MAKLEIVDSVGGRHLVHAEEYDVRGNMVYIYVLIKGDGDSLVKLDEKKMSRAYEFASLKISE